MSEKTPLKIPASPIMKNIGFGTGVGVYKYERSPRCGVVRSPWAVKKISLKFAMDDSTVESMLLNEAKILRELNHPNIISFRGFEESKPALVMEFGGRSLGQVLEEREDDEVEFPFPLPVDYVEKVIKDILKALDYLHNTAMILHADINSNNILINGEFEICKLCDFGLSLPMDKNGLVNFNVIPRTKWIGALPWCAPEFLSDNEIIDCKADIYSFGMVIYEMFTGIPPHYNTTFNNDDIENSSQDDEGETKLYGTRPKLPDSIQLSCEFQEAFELFNACSESDQVKDLPLKSY